MKEPTFTLKNLPLQHHANVAAQLAADYLRAHPSPVPQPTGPREARAPDPAKKPGRRRLVVSIIGLRRLALDDDNFNGGAKALRDSIAKSLGLDDGDKRFIWQYQLLQTRGREGYLVRIEVV